MEGVFCQIFFLSNFFPTPQDSVRDRCGMVPGGIRGGRGALESDFLTDSGTKMAVLRQKMGFKRVFWVKSQIFEIKSRLICNCQITDLMCAFGGPKGLLYWAGGYIFEIHYPLLESDHTSDLNLGFGDFPP